MDSRSTPPPAGPSRTHSPAPGRPMGKVRRRVTPSGRRALAALAALLASLGFAYGYAAPDLVEPATDPTVLTVALDEGAAAIHVRRAGEEGPVATHNVPQDFRPYIHPVVPPDGRGSFTEFSPDHHRHQTGLYWGFTRLNGRDYFHNPDGSHWRRVSARVLEREGPVVTWEVVYDLLGETGDVVLTETQIWSMREVGGRYLLDLEWRGEARTDVTISRFDYGGLFLRMPWRPGTEGGAVNAARQRDRAAEGQRAMWLDVGMRVEGRDEPLHVAIFDHPENGGFPQPWRVDGQLGVGPVRARLGDWSITAGTTEVIRHRLVFHTGDADDVELLALWESYTGREGQYTTTELWRLAREEGFEAEFLTPDEAAAAMTVLEGFEVGAWAGEPLLTQPMAFAWDDRGRLWVAENRDYESRSSGYSGSGDSRILILEDTNGDGRADTRKVFLEGIPFPAAIAVGFGGLFLGAPPHLLFVPDRDGDDVAEVDDIRILLTGWGIQDRHETINSFHWGPDGWLYGLQGFATPSRIRKPDANDRLYRPGETFPDDLFEREGVEIDGGVWRYHPVKERFEVVAHGFSNPWGIDYDARGEFFISLCVIPHVFHVVPGGIYQRQGGRHFNPYVYSDIGHIADHLHRSAHGGARIYQSDAFPAEHHGRLFMANIHERAVLSDVLEPRGSGFVARHGHDFLQANNAHWIGFSVEVGPDGALYILDWHDADITGSQVLMKDTGRIFRIAPTQSLAADFADRNADVSKLDDVRLAELQTSASDWHARRARVNLQYRATQRSIDPAAVAVLRALFEGPGEVERRLRGMWSLHLTGQLPSDRLLSALDDSEPYVRAWAVQLLTEDGEPPLPVLARFAELARSEASPVVRKYLATALQRVGDDARWEIAAALLRNAADSEDHYIPKLIWYGVEPLVPADPRRALSLAAASRIPLVTEFIARRMVDADELEVLAAGLATHATARPALLRGMRAGVQGRRDLAAPAAWVRVYPALAADPAAAALAREVAQSFGDADAARRNLAVLRDLGAPPAQRRTVLAALARQQRDEIVEDLPALIDEEALRVEAIRAVAAFDRAALGELLLARYPTLDERERREAIESLASRPAYGRMLTAALKAGTVDRRDVPANVARQLRRVVGAGFVEVWGPIDLDSGEEQVARSRYRALLTEQALAGADLSDGRLVYQRTCMACHRLYDEGGDVGPDLTGANRGNVASMLNKIINPSEDIQDAYKLVVFTMRDGRTFMGNVIGESDRQVTVRLVGQEPLVLDRADILSQEVSDVSLMPDGLLRNLSTQEILNLFAYLRTTEQVPLPPRIGR